MISFVIDLGAVSGITIVGELHKGISCRGRTVGEVLETNYFVTIFVCTCQYTVSMSQFSYDMWST